MPLHHDYSPCRSLIMIVDDVLMIVDNTQDVHMIGQHPVLYYVIDWSTPCSIVHVHVCTRLDQVDIGQHSVL